MSAPNATESAENKISLPDIEGTQGGGDYLFRAMVNHVSHFALTGSPVILHFNPPHPYIFTAAQPLGGICGKLFVLCQHVLSRKPEIPPGREACVMCRLAFHFGI